MKMKKFIFIILVITNFNAFCQNNIKIEIDIPEPRVGESVLFSLNVDFLKSDLQKKLGSEIELTRSGSFHGGESDDFERIIIFNKIGINKVGPFEFEYNGKKYITNEILVNVQPELILEESLLLRIAEQNGEKYIIVEQLVKNINKTEQNESGDIVTYLGGAKPDNFEFTNLIEEIHDNIKLTNSSSSSQTLTPKNSKTEDLGFTYSITRYKINFSDDFKGEYTLREKDFINLPKDFELKPIVLKK